MKLSQHVLLSALAGALIYIAERNIVLSSVFFLSAVFIDLDHLLDYFIFYHPKDFFHPFQFIRERLGFFLSCSWFRGKVVLVFHSFELLAVLFVLGAIYSRAVFFIALGMAFHLSLDIFWNVIIKNRSKRITFYFISYRAAKGFECRKLLSHYMEKIDKEAELAAG